MPRLSFPFLALPVDPPWLLRPEVRLRLVGVRGDPSPPFVGLVDTGAVSTILAGHLAAEVGVRPTPGLASEILVGGRALKVRQAGEIVLRIRGREHRPTGRERTIDIPSFALVTESPPFLDIALLGLHGFLARIGELRVRAREEVFEIATA